MKEWLAWNEPNNPVFLAAVPAHGAGGSSRARSTTRRSARRSTAASTATLVSGERVACGVTAPRGNNSPTSSRPSVAPIQFLRAVKSAGAEDVRRLGAPPVLRRARGLADDAAPRTATANAVTIGNINSLILELTRLYGNKRVWITEYGYQTNPPDRLFGVSYARQATYLGRRSRSRAQNPRIDMMLWFLLRDEPALGGWQSGLVTLSGKRKPAFAAFRSLRR